MVLASKGIIKFNNKCIIYTIIHLHLPSVTDLITVHILCATNRKVADSIPDGVIGIFH